MKTTSFNYLVQDTFSAGSVLKHRGFEMKLMRLRHASCVHSAGIIVLLLHNPPISVGQRSQMHR